MQCLYNVFTHGDPGCQQFISLFSKKVRFDGFSGFAGALERTVAITDPNSDKSRADAFGIVSSVGGAGDPPAPLGDPPSGVGTAFRV
jgi:hypothetical protein